MSVNIKVQSGTSVRLPTSGKYCDSDIIVTTVSGDGGIADIYDPQANPIEQGSISSASGNNVGGANRLRTNGFIEVKPNVLYRLSTNINRFYIIQYGSDKKTVVATGGWYTSGALVTMQADCEYIRLTFSNASNSDITPDEFEWLTITQFDNDTHAYERGYADGYDEGNYLHAVTDKTITTVNDERLEIITGSLFASCTELVSVYAPNVSTIGNYAFQKCRKLSTVNMPNVKSIGSQAFMESGITEANFPECEGQIGTQAFQDCTGLSKAYFPKVTSLAGSAFSRASVRRAEFDSLEEIKPSYAFNGCRNLSQLIIRTPKVCALSGDAFANTNANVLRIYVPDDLVEQYKADAAWSAYADQIKPLSELGE